MHLLVGIDTEGDNQWDAAARANQRFENIYALPRLHALFARHGVRPTYVITHPVATDPRSAEVLRKLLEGADCEVGAHHHAWETPPCTAEDVRRHQYASTLPREQFERQLGSLTDAITAAVGRRPVSYRSGRFGFSADHVSALERLGYRIDSSVAPLFYEAHKGGPDFVEAPLTPYFLAYDCATRPGGSQVLEVPVSAALNRRLPKSLQYAYARAPRPYTTKRILRAMRLLRLRWLRPSYSSLEDMIALARDLAARKEPVLNLLFHSSEAIAGGSPYNRTQGELDAFCDRLERFLAFATRELGRDRRPSRSFTRRTHADESLALTAHAYSSRHPPPPSRPGGQRDPAVAARDLGAGTGRRRGVCRPLAARGRSGRPAGAGRVGAAPNRRLHRPRPEARLDRGVAAHLPRARRAPGSRRRGARAQQRPAGRTRRPPRPPPTEARRPTLYGTEIWHYAPRRIDLFTRAYRAASYVTFYSDRLLERAGELGLRRRSSAVVYPPVGAAFTFHDEAQQADARARLGITNRHLLLNVKRLHPLAGQRDLEAMNDVIRALPDTRLVICGTGHMLDELKGVARSAGVERHVTFAGLVDNATVARYCAAADVFVLPSLLEALPTVAVEALACGTPVVSSDNPGGLELNDVFGPDVAIVPREQPIPLASAIVGFLQQKRRTLSGTRRTLAERFGSTAVAARYRAIYDEIVHSERNGQ